MYDVYENFRHRDAFGRVLEAIPDDRYLSYWDGRPRKLIVQTSTDPYTMSGNTTYRRTHIRNISPWMLQLAFWALNDPDPWMTTGKCLAAAIPLTILVRSNRLVYLRTACLTDLV